MDFFERLRRSRLLTDDQLQAARSRVQNSSEDWASAICALRVVPERQVVGLLSEHTGYPGIELSRSIVPLANLGLIPEELMRRRLVLPVVDANGSLVLAMANPDDRAVASEIGFVTGRKILRHVAVPSLIAHVVDVAFGMRAKGERFWRGPVVQGVTPGPEGTASVVRANSVAPPAEEPSAPIEGVELDDEPLQLVSILESVFETPEPPAAQERAAPPDPELAKTTQRGSLGAGKVVLVVDDDPQMRELVVRLLAPFDCAVSECDDGRKALLLALELEPDLVISDGMLPGMHGFELCRAIKGSPTLRRTAVLMISGVHTGWKVGVDVAEVYGADGFFEKPFRVEDFTRAVRQCLMLGGAGGEEVAKAKRQAALATCREAAARSKAGKMSEAIDLLRSATSKDPTCVEAHYYLGQLLRAAGDPYRAIASLERAVELRPDLEMLLSTLAELYLKQGFRKSAQEVLRRALEVCSDPTRRARLEERVKSAAA